MICCLLIQNIRTLRFVAMNYEDDNLDALEDPENVAMLLHEALEAEASEEEPADDSHDQTLQPPAKRSRPSEPLLGSEHNPDSELDSPLSLPTAPPGLVPTSKPKAAILNESKLNFDHGLSYLALETLADITSYADTSPDQVSPVYVAGPRHAGPAKPLPICA